MVLTIASSFVSGLFATFGVLLAIAVICGVGFLIKWFIETKKGMDNLPQIMLEYRKTLLGNDMFEEYVFISKFVKQLKKNKVPKELAEKYILKVDSDFGWVSGDDGFDRLGFKYTYRLTPRVPFIKKKEEKDKENPEKDTEKGKKTE